MSDAFPWKPSTLAEGHYVYAVCQSCRDVRYITRAMMLERVGDVPFKQIESRLRCIGRPRENRRGPACGGRMALDLGAVRTRVPAVGPGLAG